MTLAPSQLDGTGELIGHATAAFSSSSSRRTALWALAQLA